MGMGLVILMALQLADGGCCGKYVSTLRAPIGMSYLAFVLMLKLLHLFLCIT